MAGKKYDDDLINRAAEMREQGRSCQFIANRLGMSVSSVEYHCLRLGADTPKTAKKMRQDRRPRVMKRGGHVVRRFTGAEDKKMLALSLAGTKVAEIARVLKRPHNSVYYRLMTLARRDARKEARSGDDR